MAKANKKVVAPTHNSDLLHGIAAATQSGGFQWHQALDVAHLVAAGHVEQNHEMRDPEGRLATRATPAGIAAHMGIVPLEPTIAEKLAPSAPKFAIDTGVELAPVKRNFGGGGREPTYPFDNLAAPTQGPNGLIYASFHVPAVQDEKGEWSQPGRAIGSSLAAQNRKYARETGQFETVLEWVYQTGPDGKRVKVDGHYVKLHQQQVQVPVTVQEREFTLRTVGVDDPRGPGARVFRIK